jgi:hypothetical protein
MKRGTVASTPQQLLLPAERIERSILLIRFRSHKVMLNEQVRRNKDRFPDDFMFRLISKEKAEVVANCDHLRTLKFSPNLPYAFTEHGAIMLAGVLNTERAIKVSVYVVRAFVKLREILTSQNDLFHKIEELENTTISSGWSSRPFASSCNPLLFRLTAVLDFLLPRNSSHPPQPSLLIRRLYYSIGIEDRR